MAGVKKEARVSKEARQALITEIKTNMTEINKRYKELRELERQGDAPLDFINTTISNFREATGKTPKTNRVIPIGNLSDYGTKRLKTLLVQQKKFLKSKWSTPEGRAEIFQKQYETFTDTYNVSEENFKTIHKVLGSENFRGLKDEIPPSRAVVEYLQEEGFNKRQAVVDALPKFDTLPSDALIFIGNNIARSKRMLHYFINNPDKEGREAYEECFNISGESDTGE